MECPAHAPVQQGTSISPILISRTHSDCIVGDPNGVSCLDFLSNNPPPLPNISVPVSASQRASGSNVVPREPGGLPGENGNDGDILETRLSASGVRLPKRKPNKQLKADSG